MEIGEIIFVIFELKGLIDIIRIKEGGLHFNWES